MKVFIVLLLVAAAVESITAQRGRDCNLPPETGPCKGYLPRYYYDPTTNDCKKFIYGGCGGNKNNFETEEECYEKCRGFTDCPPNKEYGSFGDCPDSCYSLEHPVEFCTLKLNWGCICKPGYVLREDKVFDSDCIRPEECPLDVSKTQIKCPPNKELGEFGDCPDSCYSLKHPVRPCTLKLNYGCKCKPGYVLKEDKVFDSDCIKPEECPLNVLSE
ncbi:WAP four-disulfide core domain protein 8-like [Argiope bruennichi]|uniref:WAP four-disulfide core domain protein 8-like n=1 Tax=Argiope bruennichi TaxID=94029 RepID=UPI002494FE4F|nr:WAP four-disulfide core domain protein 8-like [Argiope bruennichi]